MWVKICANTNAEDALQAVKLGVDALGFVFAPSKRRVTAAQVRRITEQVPARVELVGVFSETEVERIAATVRESGLTAVQLHDGVDFEREARLRDLLRPEISLIHVVHWTVDRDDASTAAVRAQLKALADLGMEERVLIDAKAGGVSGGLGLSFDWRHARSVLAEFPKMRFVIAGGLRPENVAEAVTILRPYGVDVASGVEQEAGKKDPGKLAAFIENARRA